MSSIDCLHNLSKACNSFQESHRKEMPEFNFFIQVVSCAKILCWSFLELIKYFSFDLCLCSEFVGLFLALLGLIPLGLIYTCQFDGCGAYCMNNFGSVISVSVFLLVWLQEC